MEKLHAEEQEQRQPFSLQQAPVLAALVAFCLVISWRLLAGSMVPGQGYLWAGVACLCPIGWYCYGYLHVSGNAQSNGLLLSAVGWVFVAIAFLVHYKAILEADPSIAASAVSLTSFAWLVIIGIALLLGGAWLSWQSAIAEGN